MIDILTVLLFPCIVLREIEDEDSLWRQKYQKLRETETSGPKKDDDKPQDAVISEKERVSSLGKSSKPTVAPSNAGARNTRFY